VYILSKEKNRDLTAGEHFGVMTAEEIYFSLQALTLITFVFFFFLTRNSILI
jgi:hypothetical protein